VIRITGLSILIIWSFLLTETPAKQDTKKEAKTVKYFSKGVNVIYLSQSLINNIVW